jgi:outer membrane protein assembly factor BamB
MRLLPISLLLLVSFNTAHADDWPQFLGPHRDGVIAETGFAKTWPREGPPRAWQKDIGEGYAGPVVVGKRVVLFHRVGDRETVETLDADTGKPGWSFSYPTDYADQLGKGDGPRSTPCVSGSRVVTLGAGGWLHCVDLEKGTKLWARSLMTEYKVRPSYFGVGTSPMIHEGRVLVNVGGPKAGVVAFGLEDGKELWKATTDGASYSSPILATVGGAPRAIFFTRDGALVLDPATGDVVFRMRWRARYDASVNAAPPLLLANDLVFFTSSYETGALLVKLRKDGGDTVWTSEDALTSHYTNCVTHGGYIFGSDGRQESGARLRCIDPRPAAGPVVQWTEAGFGCASILVAGDDLILLTERGDLVLAEANAKKYVEKARAHLFDATPVRAVPAVANGRLFARDQRQLICVDLRQK